MYPRATAFLLIVGLLVAPASSAWASSLSTDAAQTRSEVIALSQDYAQQYGSKVGRREQAELQGMVREARREMDTLVRLVRKAERSDRPSDWQRARDHYLEIRDTGDDRLADARDIIAPRMSFTEQLEAWSKARSAMKELDSLGTQLEGRAR